MTDEKVWNWGILGLGQIARGHMLPSLLNHDACRVTAIASRSISGNGIPEGVTHHTSYEVMLDDSSVDIVYIALPNTMHAEWVLKALRKGKHVLCEKPMTMNRDEAQRIIEEAEMRGLQVMEGFMYRYSPRMRQLESYLDQGVIGDIRYVHTQFFSLRSRFTGIRSDKNLGGGALWDLGVYPLNLLNHLLDPDGTNNLSVIQAAGVIEQGVDSYLCGHLAYENGMIGSFSCGWVSPTRNVTTIIMGTHGKVVIEGLFMNWEPGRIEVVAEDGITAIDLPIDTPFMHEIDACIEHISRGTPLKMSLEESIRGIALTERVLQKMVPVEKLM